MRPYFVYSNYDSIILAATSELQWKCAIIMGYIINRNFTIIWYLLGVVIHATISAVAYRMIITCIWWIVVSSTTTMLQYA